jgi:hypothetical protein
VRHKESSVKRQVHSTKCLHKEIRQCSYQLFKSIPESSREKKKVGETLQKKKSGNKQNGNENNQFETKKTIQRLKETTT